MDDHAPILVFCYRRPEHLRRTLISLMKCRGFDSSPLVIYGDGPRHLEEFSDVEATRMVARELFGDRAEYHFSVSNQGLSRSVIRGVSEVLERFESVIVVEDDLDVAPEFLTYMNASLERYADVPTVYQVSGYQFAVPEFADLKTAVFLPFTVSWGWATWRRAWEYFDPFAANWKELQRDKALRQRFNLDGAYDYSRMLERQMAGLQDSWAIRWYWTVFQRQGMVLFPPVSLVQNSGFDGSGTHGRGVFRRFSSSMVAWGKFSAFMLPDELQRVKDSDLQAVQRAVSKVNGGRLAALVDRFRSLFRS